MTRFLGILALAAVSFYPAFGQSKGDKAGKMAARQDAIAQIKQMEQDWSDAQKAGDVEKLGALIAADWRGQGADGKISTKAEMLEAIKSGKSKLTSFEFGPMEVKILGNIAICQGSDVEKSSDQGKDTSGKWVWMDVFVNRGGKWLAVRSQSSRAQE